MSNFPTRSLSRGKYGTMRLYARPPFDRTRLRSRNLPRHCLDRPNRVASKGDNVAPVNVSGAMQLKNGTLGVNGLGVFGNTILKGTNGGHRQRRQLLPQLRRDRRSSGYGIRDNNGTMEFKNTAARGVAQPPNRPFDLHQCGVPLIMTFCLVRYRPLRPTHWK